jgi:serine phosphatase RsbU (regulator of sigma subunit)
MLNFFIRLLQIGISAQDHSEIKLQKQFLVFLAIFMSMGGIVWGTITFVYALYPQGMIPYGYTIVSIFNLWYFYLSKNFNVVKTIQTSISLLLPFFFQWSLGGFAPSGAIMFWAILALLASITFQSSGTSYFWLICFLLLTLFSGIFDQEFFRAKPTALNDYSLPFLVMNMTIIPSIVFGLMLYIVKKQENTQFALEEKQREIIYQNARLLENEKQLTTKNQELNLVNEKLNQYGENLEKMVVQRTQSLLESEKNLQENLQALRSTQLSLEINSQKQQILNYILRSSIQHHEKLDGFLSEVVEQLSTLNFMKLQPGIGIFIRKDEQHFDLRVHKDFSPKIQALCKTIKEGQCLCGLAALSQKTQYAHCVDHRHTTTFEGIKEHGHYNLPIILHEKVVGVLVVYLEHGHERNEREIDFLESVCFIIADTIAKIQSKELIEQQNTTLQASEEELKQNLEELQATQDQLQGNLSIVEKQRDEIVSSINYARRIQTALLPKMERMQANFKQLMLFYLPKDIVSGDFYWISNTAGTTHPLILAVADCTGHGVPGAFMTVIGNNLLDQIINKDKIYSPVQILNELDNRLIQTLKQQGIETDNVNDGMDIALVKLDWQHRKAVFAGAKRPLWIFENGQAEVTEYKGSKYPIGSSQFENKEFSEIEIDLHQGDLIYSFTDGYADQFGAQGKYKIGQFRQLLTEIKDKDFAEQKLILQTDLLRWKGTHKQTDDVLLIGIRV